MAIVRAYKTFTNELGKLDVLTGSEVQERLDHLRPRVSHKFFLLASQFLGLDNHGCATSQFSHVHVAVVLL